MNEKTIERFWKKTMINDRHEWEGTPCVDWTAYLMATGYGQFSLGNKTIRAHRFAFQITNGEIPEGLCVCHRCDRRECVNPDHLFLGTYKDNHEDMWNKGRSHDRKGNKNGRAKITEDTARLIKRFLGRHPVQVGLKKAGSVAFLSRWLGVNVWTIKNINTGRSWKHITTEGATKI